MMDMAHLAALLRSFSAAASRRGVLTALAGGLLAPLPLARDVAETDAKKNHKPGKKRKTRKKDKPSPPPPSPVTRADATCAAQTNEFFIADGNTRFAQTFTALTSGPLVSAQLQLNKDVGSAGDYILQISVVDNFGVPTNEVLAKTSVANVTVPNGTSTVTFPFASPFSVVAGTQYALVLTRPGSVNVSWHGLGGDACPGGAFKSPNQTAPFAAISAESDLLFTTFVRS